ncbi:hypothetical protein EBB07_29075 [Paenibacillaceae bacterium]|nr:hypothetical protein EBB07_29075 [Paenibacillaceae bacterium]
MTRLDVIKDRFENVARVDIDPRQAWQDINILLEEIHERDIIISDFREQIIELKKKLSEDCQCKIKKYRNK